MPVYLRYLFVLVVATTGIWLIHRKYENDIALARLHYRLESHEQSLQVVKTLESSFVQMYQGMRTIGRLPGVQNIDRYATNLTGDSRTAIQEIYNNTASNVSLSEIYVVQKDIDPDKIDPHTHQPETPITTFDHLIVNRTADTKEDAETGPKVPEIEIYEYRLEKKQLAWMAQNCPTQSGLSGLDYPAVLGPEVITCDNSRYDAQKPDDKDRSGLVYSVPFFDLQGKLKGCITGVILTHAFRDLLPSGNYVLRNKKYAYSAVPNMGGAWQSSQPSITQDQPDPSLIYSEEMPVKVVDRDGDWALWAGLPNSVFWSRGDVKAARQTALTAGLIVGALTIGGIVMILGDRRRKLEQQQKSLEQSVAERNRELSEAQEKIKGIVTNLHELLEEVADSAAIVATESQHLGLSASEATCTTDEITEAVQTVAQAARSSAVASRSMYDGSLTQQEAAATADRDAAKAAGATQEVAASAQQMAQAAYQAAEVARSGSARVEQTVLSMARIEQQVTAAAQTIAGLDRKSQEIGAIVGTITEIADQTNLLALNAAIEAARAGEHGRGFAVVADEVRKLSERSAAATQEIGALIQSIRTEVECAVQSMANSTREVAQGAAQSKEAGAGLQEIQSAANSVADEVGRVTERAAETSHSVHSVQKTVSEVRAIIEHNNQQIAQMSRAAEDVQANADRVLQMTSRQSSVIAEVKHAADRLQEMATRMQKLVREAENQEAAPIGSPITKPMTKMKRAA